MGATFPANHDEGKLAMPVRERAGGNA